MHAVITLRNMEYFRSISIRPHTSVYYATPAHQRPEQIINSDLGHAEVALYLSSCSRINSKISILCLSCQTLDEEHWEGNITGIGVWGSINARLLRIKHRCAEISNGRPLISILTVCNECQESSDSENNNMAAAKFGSSIVCNQKLGAIALHIQYKKIDQVLFSGVMLVEGFFMDKLRFFNKGVQLGEFLRYHQTIL